MNTVNHNSENHNCEHNCSQLRPQHYPQHYPQLFCFTHAGGNASFFDQIEQDLAEAVDVVKFDYAGHGFRHKESLYKDFNELADDIFTQFKNNYTGGEYSLFGYSMGAVTLVEVLKRILASSDIPEPKQPKLPKHVFLGAHGPNTKRELLDFSPSELDDWVKERTLKFGTVPEKLINNKTFWRMYLPLYRADYTLLAGYNFENLNLHTDIPATIFYSETDTPLKEMKLWEKYFTGRVDYHCYEGQHFFIKEHHAEMANVIVRELRVDEGSRWRS